MNVASISVTKQFGFGLNVLVQNLLRKFERRGRVNTQTGNGTLDEVFVKINGERFYLWRAVDHEGEVLECYVTRRRNKAAAKKFLIKAMRKHGSPKIITTDKLPSYGAAFREIRRCG
jgi:transposase-like protein